MSNPQVFHRSLHNPPLRHAAETRGYPQTAGTPYYNNTGYE